MPGSPDHQGSVMNKYIPATAFVPDRRWVRNIALAVLAVSLLLSVVALWYFDPLGVPTSVRDFLYRTLGEQPASTMSHTVNTPKLAPQPVCANEHPDWRKAQVIEGVEIQESKECEPDNPYEVAAAVKGTNNVSSETLLNTDLAKDAVEICCDLDNDGDPDVVKVRLEVTELNGNSPDIKDRLPRFEVAPGIAPGMWVFTPKSRGMATKDFVNIEANPLLRPPSPAIRVEQGDRVEIILENTHYMPHTIHLHGVDHPFETADGIGNDGVPLLNGRAVDTLPGAVHVYKLQPRTPGTFLYHCHTHESIHMMMGLFGMFIVEENRPNNFVQTLNIGAGHVRHPSKAILEQYAREFDLQYSDIDLDLNDRIKESSDPRVISWSLHQSHSEAHKPHPAADVFLVNGKAFPYSLRDSVIFVHPDEKVKLRIANTGMTTLALHPHGHKFKITHTDGMPLPPQAQYFKDVVGLEPAERVDVLLQTTNDGIHADGPGAWIIHDHRMGGMTRGIGPGGGDSIIAYDSYQDDKGIPKFVGDVAPLFTPEYYQGKVPVFAGEGVDDILGAPPAFVWSAKESIALVVLLALWGVAAGAAVVLVRTWRRA